MNYSELNNNSIGNQRAIDNEEMWNEYYYQKEEEKQLNPPVITLEELEREKENYEQSRINHPDY